MSFPINVSLLILKKIIKNAFNKKSPASGFETGDNYYY